MDNEDFNRALEQILKLTEQALTEFKQTAQIRPSEFSAKASLSLLTKLSKYSPRSTACDFGRRHDLVRKPCLIDNTT